MASAFIKSIQDPIAKEWYARAAVGLLSTDGVLSTDEQDYFDGIIMFLENDDLKAELKNAVRRGQPPVLGNLDIDRRETARIFLELIEMLLKDERLDNAEVQHLLAIGGHLGFEGGYCRKAMKWAEEMLRVEKAKNDLIAQGSSQKPRYK